MVEDRHSRFLNRFSLSGVDVSFSWWPLWVEVTLSVWHLCWALFSPPASRESTFCCRELLSSAASGLSAGMFSSPPQRAGLRVWNREPKACPGGVSPLSRLRNQRHGCNVTGGEVSNVLSWNFQTLWRSIETKDLAAQLGPPGDWDLSWVLLTINRQMPVSNQPSGDLGNLWSQIILWVNSLKPWIMVNHSSYFSLLRQEVSGSDTLSQRVWLRCRGACLGRQGFGTPGLCVLGRWPPLSLRLLPGYLFFSGFPENWYRDSGE